MEKGKKIIEVYQYAYLIAQNHLTGSIFPIFANFALLSNSFSNKSHPIGRFWLNQTDFSCFYDKNSQP